MSVQPHPIPGAPAAQPAEPALALAKPAPIWMQRLSLFILVLFCVYLGVIVMALPWWTSVWDRNPLFITHPALLAFLKSGLVRGVISGCGMLDIWIGISEAVNYREHPGPQ
jgi:hypothetical protein